MFLYKTIKLHYNGSYYTIYEVVNESLDLGHNKTQQNAKTFYYRNGHRANTYPP